MIPYKLLILLSFLTLLACSKNESNTSAKQTEAQFYKEHNQMLADNAKRVETILNDDFAFSGLEYIYVDFGKIYYSFWGHALIRFVGSGKSPNEDITLSFIADFNDYELDNWKAYFGGYEVLSVIKPLSAYMDEYIVGESRKMYRYVLNASQKEREKFLNIIRSWIKDTKKAGPYTFRVNNCSGLIMKSLHQAGISQISNYETYPFDMPIQFYQAGVSVLPPEELSYNKNRVFPQTLYEKLDNPQAYYEVANQYYSSKKLNEYYDYKKRKAKKELDPYIFRFIWWAKKLSTLLNN